MSNKVSSQLSLFDAPLFKFTFKIMAKKTSIYLSIALYFVLILAYTSIVPSIAKVDPIQLFSIQTSAMFLMFCMSLVASFIAIEIFRTSIDDGTELLTVSKPISRKEIVFVKLTIFLLYILIVAVLSAGLASFMFLTGYGTTNDNLIVLLGMLIATIIVGIIFGSIATLLSLYCRKIIALLITLSITFILMVYSMLGSFIIESPTKLMQKQGENITPISLIDVNEKNGGVSVVQGASTVGGTKSPKELWNEYRNKSNYYGFVKSDFGYQISSIYTLGKPSGDVVNTLSMMSVYNSPVDFKFSNTYDLNKDLSVLQFDLPKYFDNVDFSNVTSMGLSQNSSAKIANTDSPKYNQYLYLNTNQLQSKVVDSNVNLDWDYIWDQKEYSVPNIDDANFDASKSLVNYNDYEVKMTMSEYISKLAKIDRDKHKDQLNEYYTKDLASIFVKEYVEDRLYDNIPTSQILDELDNILLSAFYKLSFDATTKDVTDSEGNITQETDYTQKQIRFSQLFDLNVDVDPNLTLGDIYTDFDTFKIKDPITQQEMGVKEILKELFKNDGYTVETSSFTSTTTWLQVMTEVNKDTTLKTQIENDAKNRDEYKTILDLLGFKSAKYINKSNSNLTTFINNITDLTSSSFSSSAIFNTGLFDFDITTTFDFKDNKTEQFGDNNLYLNSTYRSSYSLVPTYLLSSSFMRAEVVSSLNNVWLIVGWTIVSIVIFAITMILYSRRDFA